MWPQVCWRKAAILGVWTTPNQKELGWKSRKGVQTQGFGLYSAVTENQVVTSLIKKRVETISVCARIGDEDSSIYLPFIWNHIKTCLLVQRGTSHIYVTRFLQKSLRTWGSGGNDSARELLPTHAMDSCGCIELFLPTHKQCLCDFCWCYLKLFSDGNSTEDETEWKYIWKT